MIGQHIHAPPVAPRWHDPQVPPALESLVLRLLAKDPVQSARGARWRCARRSRRSPTGRPEAAPDCGEARGHSRGRSTSHPKRALDLPVLPTRERAGRDTSARPVASDALPNLRELWSGALADGESFAVTVVRSSRPHTPPHSRPEDPRAAQCSGGRAQAGHRLPSPDVASAMPLSQQVGDEEYRALLERFRSIRLRRRAPLRGHGQPASRAMASWPCSALPSLTRTTPNAPATRHCAREISSERYPRSFAAKGIPFATRIGLNSGDVIVEKIGDDLRMDYTAQGQTANLAKRMEELAQPGEVYLAPETARLVEGYFDLEALGARDVKGMSEPTSPVPLRLQAKRCHAYTGLLRAPPTPPGPSAKSAAPTTGRVGWVESGNGWGALGWGACGASATRAWAKGITIRASGTGGGRITDQRTLRSGRRSPGREPPARFRSRPSPHGPPRRPNGRPSARRHSGGGQAAFFVSDGSECSSSRPRSRVRSSSDSSNSSKLRERSPTARSGSTASLSGSPSGPV